MLPDPFLCPYCDAVIFRASKRIYLELASGKMHSCMQIVEHDRSMLERCFAAKSAIKMPPGRKQ